MEPGEALKSGGVVSGLIALGLTAVFSKYGAGVIFVLIAAIMLMVVFHVSPVDIVDRIRERPRVEYEEEELPEPKPRERRRAPEPESAARRQQVPQIDIPVDDGPLVGKRPEPKPIEKKERFSTGNPRCPRRTRYWPVRRLGMCLRQNPSPCPRRLRRLRRQLRRRNRCRNPSRSPPLPAGAGD